MAMNRTNRQIGVPNFESLCKDYCTEIFDILDYIDNYAKGEYDAIQENVYDPSEHIEVVSQLRYTVSQLRSLRQTIKVNASEAVNRGKNLNY